MNEKKVIEKYFVSLPKKSQIKPFGKREQRQTILKKKLKNHGEGLLARCALTSLHHVQDERLVVFGLVLEVGVGERADEFAPVGSLVLKGNVGDVDGAVLQVLGLLAAVPAQAVGETLVDDVAFVSIVRVKLGQKDRSDRQNWRRSSLSDTFVTRHLRSRFPSCHLFLRSDRCVVTCAHKQSNN